MTNKLGSIKQACEWFWSVEQRLHVLRLQNDGVFFWRLMRFPLYRLVTEQSGLVEAAHPNTQFTLRQRMAILWALLYGSVFRNPLFSGCKETVVIPHARQVGGVDIYSQALLEQLPPEKTLVLYGDWRGQQAGTSRNMAFSLLKNNLLKHWRKFGNKGAALSEENAALLREVQAEIRQHFGIAPPVEEMAKKHSAAFCRYRQDYLRVFRRVKAQKLYIVVGYGVPQLAAVAAAQECGMEVIELQHGVFTPYHLGYSFPVDGDVVPYTPDVLHTFGTFWEQSTLLPTSMRCEVVGSAYMYDILAGYRGKPKDSSVVFASQAPISRELLRFAVEAARLLPEREVIYRLHPSESKKDCAARLAELAPTENFVLSQGEPSTYALIAKAEVLVGVSSTVLFEGMVLGCKTIVVDLPSVEYMLPTVEMGHAVLVATPEAFCAALETAPICPDPLAYYAPPVEGAV